MQRDETRTKAAQFIHIMMTEIVLTPEDREVTIDVRGDLAYILTIALKRKTAPQESESSGTQIGRPDMRTADVVPQEHAFGEL